MAIFQEVHLRHSLQERRKAGGAEMQPRPVQANEREDLYRLVYLALMSYWVDFMLSCEQNERLVLLP